jgi:uncharacterized protein (DUF362 family)
VPSEKTTVSVVDIQPDLAQAVRRVMDEHSVADIIKRKPRVYVKVNGIDFKPYCYTSTEVTAEVIDYCQEAGAAEVFLMENSTQSNFTRLVFHVAGFTKMARRHGARVLYLDEGKQVPVMLPHVGYQVRVSEHVKSIIDDRDRVTYINVPRLKTHSMTVLTGGIKNQYGFVTHADRPIDHNYKLHRKIADIYSVIRPDFTLVDGTVATVYGHYPAEALQKEALVPFNILIGGTDTLAVDVVSARVFGYKVEEVPHLAEAQAMELGVGDLERIDIDGSSLDRFNRKYSYHLYDAFPPDVEVIRGTERNCVEGCDANVMTLLQMLYLDFQGKGGFTILMGKGFDPEMVEALEGRVFIAGTCAYDEVGERLIKRLGKRNVAFTTECNDLAGATGGLAKFMKVNTMKIVPLNPLKSLQLLLQAKMHHTTARIPPLIQF